MQKSKIILTAAILLVANLAAVAQEARFPNLDTEKLCRSRAKSAEEMMGDKTVSAKTFETCMRSEGEARNALVAAWKDIPPTYKAACIRPAVFSASYEEWISCLELNIDVKNLRKKP